MKTNWKYIMEWSDGNVTTVDCARGWKDATRIACATARRSDAESISRHAPNQPHILARRAFKKVAHQRIKHGRCPVCGHYGDDCTGKRGRP